MGVRESLKKNLREEHAGMHGLYAVAGVSIALALVLFLVASTVNAVKANEFIGKDLAYQSSLPVTGKGEVSAVPDIASFNFSVVENAGSVAEAQKSATDKNNAIVAYLKEKGIEEKDIQTTGFNINPQYRYEQASGKQILTGYQVSESVTVKVRAADTAGQVLSDISGMGVANVSGLSFTVDDEASLQLAAKEKAIMDAKEQADKLASALGVHLGDVIGYYENQDSPDYPRPMYDSAAGSAMKAESLPAVQIEPGQEKVTASVTVTYEIK